MLRALIVTAALIVAMPATAEDSPLTKADVETIIRDYLLTNPEILEQAFTALQEQREEAEQVARVAALEELRGRLENSGFDPVIGNPDGDVTIVEFFDYNCGFCRRAMDDLDRLIEDDPNLRVVLKEFPVLGQASMEAAAVSIAVNKKFPEAYGDFHKNLMRVEGQADGEVALGLAAEMGLPREELEELMGADAVRTVVEDSYEIAQALGLSGTPSYVVGDAVEFGAVGFDQLRSRINESRCGQPEC